MQTKQVIQSSVNVIKITNISIGDVYKRFDKDYDDRVYFGLVTSVHNDGENTIIEATEYRASWSSLDIEYKILRGEKDYILFPSSPEELNLQFDTIKTKKIRAIENAKETIIENEKHIREIEGLISGETQKKLKAMDYKELSQEEYNKRKEALLG